MRGMRKSALQPEKWLLRSRPCFGITSLSSLHVYVYLSCRRRTSFTHIYWFPCLHDDEVIEVIDAAAAVDATNTSQLKLHFWGSSG